MAGYLFELGVIYSAVPGKKDATRIRFDLMGWYRIQDIILPLVYMQ